jgi:peptide chain release factor 1
MLQDKLQRFINRFNKLNDLLMSPEILSDIKKMTNLSREQSSISKIVNAAYEYKQIITDIEENKILLNDDELVELAKEELKVLEARKPELEEEIKILLLPKDPKDEKNIFIELRAGAGGDEAGLFVADMYRTYIKYAENEGWKTEIMNSSESEAGGYKEMILLVKGDSVYSKLKFEAGVHRVQRVPATETQGRVHTSAITVAIIPEVDDVDIDIRAEDLKMDTMRSSGCGGQSVNTTDSAVRITHIPSGIVVTNQDQKSQHKNREKAMRVLKARLFDMQEQERMDKEGADRKAQVGSGDRSARIRTYNYPQGRISDHRINLTLYRLDVIMNDGLLNEIIYPLITDHQSRLMEMSGV